jgi:plasmid stabilization system protein ParE
MAKLVIHSHVNDEFVEAFEWYEKRSPRAAQTFQSRVRQTFDRVAADPLGGTVYDADHRFYRIKKYPHLVIYRTRLS